MNWSGAVVFVGLEFLMVARVAVSPRTIFISFSLSVRSCVTSSWSFLNCGLVVSATERAVLAETCPFKVSMSWWLIQVWVLFAHRLVASVPMSRAASTSLWATWY